MTDKTATQNLTRTTSTDDPKQMATYLATLASEVDLRMAAHYYDLGRSQRPPFAVVRRLVESAFDITSSGRVGFDTVEEDTAGLVDLSVSDLVINLRQTGWWMFGGYIHCTGFGSAASDTSINVLAAGVNAVNAVRDAAIGLAAVSVSSLTQVTTPNVSTCTMSISFAGASTSNVTTLRFAEMWAYKVRDL